MISNRFDKFYKKIV